MRIARSLIPGIALLLLIAFSSSTFVFANNQELQINHAVYGAEGHGKDVTNRLRAQARNGSIDITVDNDSMGGDPNEHTKKTLKVDYTYRGRREHKVVNEHDRLRLP